MKRPDLEYLRRCGGTLTAVEAAFVMDYALALEAARDAVLPHAKLECEGHPKRWCTHCAFDAAVEAYHA